MTAAFLLAAVHALAPGEPVVVEHPVAEVVVVAGDVRLAAPVRGNVVVVLGDLEVAAEGEVEGDALVLGGSLTGAGQVRGRALVVGGEGGQARTLGLLRVGLWLLAAFVILALAPATVRRGGGLCQREWGWCLLAGLAWVVFWAAVAMLGCLWLPGRWLVLFLVPWAGLLVLVKASGLVAVAWMVGTRLRPWLPTLLRGEFARTGLAMLLLVALGLPSGVGAVFWLLVNLLAMGAVVRVSGWAGARRAFVTRPHSTGPSFHLPR